MTDTDIQAVYRQIQESIPAHPGALEGWLHQAPPRTGRYARVALVGALATVAAVASTAVVAELRSDTVSNTSASTVTDDQVDLTVDGRAWAVDTAAYRQRLLQAAADSGQFTGAALEGAARTVLIHGTGSMPQSVQDLASEAPEGTTIKWVTVPLNEADLARVMEELDIALSARGASFGSDFASIEVRVDVADAELPAVREQANAMSPVPVTVVADRGPHVNLSGLDWD